MALTLLARPFKEGVPIERDANGEGSKRFLPPSFIQGLRAIGIERPGLSGN